MQDLLLSVVERRICDHYLPKLCAALDCVDAGMLWDESDPNAVGAIVLHLMEHIGYHAGQVVYATRAKTGCEFRFAQSGLDEAALRRLVEQDRLG